MARNVTGDAALIAALAAGKSYRVAASIAGISARTVTRRMADPAFRSQVEQARRETVERAVRRVSAATTRAADTLEVLLNSRSDQVRYQAAQSLLNLALKWRGEVEIEERIADLETRAREIEGHQQ